MKRWIFRIRYNTVKTYVAIIESYKRWPGLCVYNTWTVAAASECKQNCKCAYLARFTFFSVICFMNCLCSLYNLLNH